MTGLLDGIRVLESASLFNGDRLGCLLGDLGADVIKVESPRRGDYLRDILGQITPRHSPAHLQVNRNKRSVALDLRNSAGRQLFWRLLDTADVFVDGNVSGVCDRLDIGYDAQSRRKPQIVYCSYTGFGAAGPYSTVPTHGQMPPALAGATPVETGADGLARKVNRRGLMGSPASGGEGTATGAAYAAFHVAAALWRSERTGRGAYLDVSSADAVLANAYIYATYELNAHRLTDHSMLLDSDDTGNRSAKYQFYRTRDDKHVLFCAIEPKFWRHFCQAAGRPDLIDEAGGDGPVDYADHHEELRRTVGAVIAERDLAEWMALAAAHDIPIGPAYHDLSEAVDDPHLRARGVFQEGTHPHAGEFTYVVSAALVDGQPATVRRPAPLLGEHTRDVLREVGLSADEVDALVDDGIAGESAAVRA